MKKNNIQKIYASFLFVRNYFSMSKCYTNVSLGQTYIDIVSHVITCYIRVAVSYT